jgi:hypothetical protein
MGHYINVQGEVWISAEGYRIVTALHTRPEGEREPTDYYRERARSWSYDETAGRFAFEVEGKLMFHLVEHFVALLAYLKDDDEVDVIRELGDIAKQSWFLRAGEYASVNEWVENEDEERAPATVDEVRRWDEAPPVLSGVHVEDETLVCTTIRGTMFRTPNYLLCMYAPYLYLDTDELASGRIIDFGRRVTFPERDGNEVTIDVAKLHAARELEE